ncbi:MerR family transcriptional regulator [Plantactinospora sp. BB1]|uniref:MerR family transcriptional regulator n=1 Tax=Plantactinospora sp. BB1 TaxID=2071627 RepID=UPI000D16BE54|nr:MerR family transcriptional regulator [Plantactinospora sp. BB1]AVT41135.1 MerR family transcriptional regulator [Plantactinospora sp. BB1]
MTRELLPIGAFARLCRLSVKQLRHYDEVGLLRPASVDPATGYRYYRRTQVRDAMVIALLRGLDVPLAAITRVLTGDEEARAAVLRTERSRLAERIAAQQRSWQLLDRLLTGDLLTDGLLRHEVTMAQEPARRLLVRRAVCAPEEIGATLGGEIGPLMAGMAGLDWRPPVWGLFPVDLGSQLRVAVGVQSDVPADAVPGTAVEELPPGPVVAAVHVGPYEHLTLTYQAVFAWIHERGLRPCGQVREAYLADPVTTEPAQLVTRVVVPIEDEEPS